MARDRLDKVLVDRGLAPSRERARAIILAGKVTVDGQRVTKAGHSFDPTTAEVALREPDHPYVSRGALKLIQGLDSFGISVEGKVALDIGASTGGFTDVLLRRGARRVYAIDVGYGQLAWALRQDERVVVLERHNVRDMDLALVPEPADLAVIDVSFISLTLVLPRIVELLRPSAAIGAGALDGTPAGAPAEKPIIALVKPQFEAGREHVGKGGVVRDPQARLAAVAKVRDWAGANGLIAGDYVESPITGPAGNVEYMLLLLTKGT
jgi:23S rRNA (cytidine1920-2'-O)/16S rRNA (cytidine1409-2'-O)-methyltransferase